MMTTVEALCKLRDVLLFPADDSGAQQFGIGETLGINVSDFSCVADPVQLGHVVFEYDFHCDLAKIERLIRKYSE